MFCGTEPAENEEGQRLSKRSEEPSTQTHMTKGFVIKEKNSKSYLELQLLDFAYSTKHPTYYSVTLLTRLNYSAVSL